MSSRSAPVSAASEATLAPILRGTALLAVVVIALAVLASLSDASPLDASRSDSGAPSRADPAQSATAARAVTVLTGPHPDDARLPPDFAVVTGHRVLVVAGRPLSADGGCSSPVRLPAAFDDACRAHDLGYDLLRYAARHGEPLGGWARRALDAQLAHDLSAACGRSAARAGCRVMAGLADAAVGANSWRQGYRVPVVETAGRIVVTTIAATVTGGAFTGAT